MKSGQLARVRFGFLAVMLALGGLVPLALAQTGNPPGAPAAPPTDSPVTPGAVESDAELIIIFLAIAALAFVVVSLASAIDRRRKREDEAVRLQTEISDALLRDRNLASLPVTPTVYIPVWRRAQARVEIRGQVPTAELRQAVLHVAEQEASRFLEAFAIQDQLAVVPSMGSRAA